MYFLNIEGKKMLEQILEILNKVEPGMEEQETDAVIDYQLELIYKKYEVKELYEVKNSYMG